VPRSSTAKVGPSGKVIGIDMALEMLAIARYNASLLGVTNVESFLGEIEDLPLCAISDCEH